VPRRHTSHPLNQTPRAKAEANTGSVEHGRRERETRRIGKDAGRSGLRAMRVTMKKRKEPDDRGTKRERRLDPDGNEQPQRHDLDGDRGLNKGNLQAQARRGKACEHRRYEGHRPRQDRTAPDKRCPNTNRRHDKYMVGAGHRMENPRFK
jgi:hypothetical protein